MTIREQIWEWAEQMMVENGGVPVAPKEIVERAREAGIHEPTARTQYRLWQKSGGAPVAKRGAVKNEVKLNATTDYARAKADKERALADLRMMEVQERQRVLLQASEVEQTVAVAFHRVAQTMLSLPDTLERMAALTTEQTTLAENVIHTAMQALADDLRTLGVRA